MCSVISVLLTNCFNNRSVHVINEHTCTPIRNAVRNSLCSEMEYIFELLFFSVKDDLINLAKKVTRFGPSRDHV